MNILFCSRLRKLGQASLDIYCLTLSTYDLKRYIIIFIYIYIHVYCKEDLKTSSFQIVSAKQKPKIRPNNDLFATGQQHMCSIFLSICWFSSISGVWKAKNEKKHLEEGFMLCAPRKGLPTKLYDCFIPPERSTPISGKAPNGTRKCKGGTWSRDPTATGGAFAKTCASLFWGPGSSLGPPARCPL